MTTLDIRPSQCSSDAHASDAEAEQAGPDQAHHANHARFVGSVDIHPGQSRTDSQRCDAGVEQAGTSHDVRDAPYPLAGSDNPPPGSSGGVLVGDMGESFAASLLALLADSVDDLERTRIAAENRVRHLTRDAEDSDGETRGLGLPEDVPAVRAMLSVADGLKAMEHQAVLALRRVLRTHPLGPWVKQTIGVGEKQGARLIAAIGDPYWNSLHNRPRTVSELWAYCGLHVLPVSQSTAETHTRSADGSKQGGDPAPIGHAPLGHTDAGKCGVAPRRQKGQRVNWSTTAKTRAFLIAESCVKQRSSPYRNVYDAGRLKYADSIHQQDCARCGPKSKPALAGTPLSLGHQHARAMRLVMKAVLKDLWRESARLHGATEAEGCT